MGGVVVEKVEVGTVRLLKTKLTNTNPSLKILCHHGAVEGEGRNGGVGEKVLSGVVDGSVELRNNAGLGEWRGVFWVGGEEGGLDLCELIKTVSMEANHSRGLVLEVGVVVELWMHLAPTYALEKVGGKADVSSRWTGQSDVPFLERRPAKLLIVPLSYFPLHKKWSVFQTK